MSEEESGGRAVVSVIIPHLNGKYHLDDCLGSLRRQSYSNFETILVDNGSSDGTQEYVRTHYPEVKLVELGDNKGFTGACNAGFNVSKGDLIILLNNDTEVDANWLEALVSAFERVPSAGSIASKMMLFDQRETFHTAGDYYRINGLPGNRGVWQHDNGQYDRETFVFGACGGAAAYRRSLLEEIGFLDDDFYFSCEDIDLAWRIHLAGSSVLYTPDAVVYHKLKASAGSGTTSSYYDGRNFLYVIWKNYPSSLLRAHWPAIAAAQLSISAEALRSWRGQAARAKLRGQIAGLFGYFKMRHKRRIIQAKKQIDDHLLETLLTPVDETP